MHAGINRSEARRGEARRHGALCPWKVATLFRSSVSATDRRLKNERRIIWNPRFLCRETKTRGEGENRERKKKKGEITAGSKKEIFSKTGLKKREFVEIFCEIYLFKFSRVRLDHRH